jgi:hypothetical protein
MPPFFDFRTFLSRSITVTGIFAGALSVWFALALLKMGILFWIDGTPFDHLFGDWFIYSKGLFRFEAFCLIIWIIVEIFRYYDFLVRGNFRVGFIGGASRGLVLSLCSGFVGMIIYFAILSPEGGKRYRSSDLGETLMSEPARDYFSPTALEQVQKKSEVSEKGKALADSLAMGQFVSLVIVILFFYGMFVGRELLVSPQSSDNRSAIYAFYQESTIQRGGRMNNK